MNRNKQIEDPMIEDSLDFGSLEVGTREQSMVIPIHSNISERAKLKKLFKKFPDMEKKQIITIFEWDKPTRAKELKKLTTITQ